MDKETIIQQEIRRLSLRIASARYDLLRAVLAGTPPAFMHDLCQEISICQLQRSALRDNRFAELPYNIKILYDK